MTGAGASNVAYVEEDSYLTVPGAPTYYQPGPDLQAEEVELSNALSRLRFPSDVEPSTNLAENFEGALTVSWTLAGNQFHNLVFSDDSDASGLNDSFATGLFPSSTWYMGVQYPDSNTSTAKYERALNGYVPVSADITYQQGTEARVTLTGVYGDESSSTSFTPGTIQQDNSPVPSGGASLSIDGTAVSDLQAATLSVGPLARLQRGPGRHPLRAVQGPVAATLTTEATFTTPDYAEYAYGGSGATSPQDDVTDVSGTLTFTDAGGSTVAEYTLSGMAPQNYSWSDLIVDDADLTDPVTWAVNGVTATA